MSELHPFFQGIFAAVAPKLVQPKQVKTQKSTRMFGQPKVSDCCGAAPRSIRNGDCSTEDFGLCPECGDHCEYIEEGSDDDASDHSKFNYE